MSDPVDILDSIDLLLTDARVLTQDELFAAAFERIVGVDGGEFNCNCSIPLDDPVQIGHTFTSRRGIDWEHGEYISDLYFQIYNTPNYRLRDDDEVHPHYTNDPHGQNLCWKCDWKEYDKEIGLCLECIDILKWEADEEKPKEWKGLASLLGVSEGERGTFSVELRATGDQ